MLTKKERMLPVPTSPTSVLGNMLINTGEDSLHVQQFSYPVIRIFDYPHECNPQLV
jgi:hypothetical protein